MLVAVVVAGWVWVQEEPVRPAVPTHHRLLVAISTGNDYDIADHRWYDVDSGRLGPVLDDEEALAQSRTDPGAAGDSASADGRTLHMYDDQRGGAVLTTPRARRMLPRGREVAAVGDGCLVTTGSPPGRDYSRGPVDPIEVVDADSGKPLGRVPLPEGLILPGGLFASADCRTVVAFTQTLRAAQDGTAGRTYLARIGGGTPLELLPGPTGGPTRPVWSSDGWMFLKAGEEVLALRSGAAATERVAQIRHLSGVLAARPR
ncbi:hypothetical protein [Vallicoccus soli]|uniref:Uncharacterized protein n=1 Tax=Vallicoccus soli TaxID=2339232 RepID=A0A3A3YS52_9ACTN|nr:hypothetical protein [Vallicoccus soli]RJK92501.1 hypothetical protein D5H78_18660 [Vallicoccus soli]